jgi:hypothetical protein
MGDSDHVARISASLPAAAKLRVLNLLNLAMTSGSPESHSDLCSEFKPPSHLPSLSVVTSSDLEQLVRFGYLVKDQVLEDQVAAEIASDISILSLGILCSQVV